MLVQLLPPSSFPLGYPNTLPQKIHSKYFCGQRLEGKGRDQHFCSTGCMLLLTHFRVPRLHSDSVLGSTTSTTAVIHLRLTQKPQKATKQRNGGPYPSTMVLWCQHSCSTLARRSPKVCLCWTTEDTEMNGNILCHT